MSQIELILSRHGETEENKLHIMQGQLPGHLSELGKHSNGRRPAERITAGGDSSSSRNGLGHIYRESSG